MKLILFLYTREIPALGGISLALRGSGACGATFGEAAAFGGGERTKSLIKKNKKNRGATGAPRLGRQLTPPWAAKKKNLGCLRRPKFQAPPAPLPGGDCSAPFGFKNVTRSM